MKDSRWYIIKCLVFLLEKYQIKHWSNFIRLDFIKFLSIIGKTHEWRKVVI